MTANDEAAGWQVGTMDRFQHRLESRFLRLAALFDDAMADNAPLQTLVARYVTPAMLKEIAGEYAKGRLLFIATTNLDARRPVIWNIGKIAASGNPKALDLVRKILVASAAIPVGRLVLYGDGHASERIAQVLVATIPTR